MTPKLRLREQAKKALLSSMRKFRLPGNSRTMLSTHMIAAPDTQAIQGQYRISAPSRDRGEAEARSSTYLCR